MLGGSSNLAPYGALIAVHRSKLTSCQGPIRFERPVTFFPRGQYLGLCGWSGGTNDAGCVTVFIIRYGGFQSPTQHPGQEPDPEWPLGGPLIGARAFCTPAWRNGSMAFFSMCSCVTSLVFAPLWPTFHPDRAKSRSMRRCRVSFH